MQGRRAARRELRNERRAGHAGRAAGAIEGVGAGLGSDARRPRLPRKRGLAGRAASCASPRRSRLEATSGKPAESAQLRERVVDVTALCYDSGLVFAASAGCRRVPSGCAQGVLGEVQSVEAKRVDSPTRRRVSDPEPQRYPGAMMGGE